LLPSVAIRRIRNHASRCYMCRRSRMQTDFPCLVPFYKAS
jgi:hypothetical protein